MLRVGELLCMYCRTFGIYQSSFMLFVSQWKFWLQVVSAISRWLWFVRWQENPPQGCFLLLLLFPAIILVIFPVPQQKRNHCFCSDLLRSFFLHRYLIHGFDFAPVTSYLCLKCQDLKIQKISSCFLPGVDSVVRYLQLSLTHQIVILWPKSPTHWCFQKFSVMALIYFRNFVWKDVAKI